MSITASEHLISSVVSVLLLLAGLPGVKLWLNISLPIWQAWGRGNVPPVLCRPCHTATVDPAGKESVERKRWMEAF